MKQPFFPLFIILISFVFFACSKDNEANIFGEELIEEGDTVYTSVIKPYSYDLTSQGATIKYIINTRKVSTIEATCKYPTSTEWNSVEIQMQDSMATIELHDLEPYVYYSVKLTAYNTLGEYYTNTFNFLYDYEVMKVTCFKQPFIVWNSLIENVKQALDDAGNIIDEEHIINNEFHVSYLFNYKELQSVYIFSSDKRLKNVLIILDKERVSIDELKRFITGAFGYLAYGNIHANIDGNPLISPLYKTPDGSSYVTIYERANTNVVDYMDVKDVDITKVLYR